ncbi:serine carboxypeptidase, putative [Ricinus communis]|uniref:Serine carboxypeptidase, putative n=1 Tax=Ricinus communis TaxID=3988 RepID=B9SIN5_RICCO|nr:serine carboxypeptidase, putative [Ricinus communis]
MASTSARNSVLNCACFHLLLLLFFAENTESGRIVKTLPGYSGDLPFQLETGYITVNESELFYLFVESQGKPQQDPLLVYLIGGPGCSALNGFFFQTGPLVLNTANYSGGLPQLLNNPYSWTKSSSIIFVDAPVGTGYSYATIPEGYYTSDTESTAQIYMFLRKSAKNSCNGNYVDVDSSNAACLEDLEEIDACIDPINDENVLDPVCAKLSPKSDGEQFRRSLKENSRNSRTRFRKFHNYWCRGTIEEWYRCNISLQENAYTYNIQSAVDYYRNLSANYGTQVLLYSGDHDLVVPYISTLDWMETLNLTVDYAWRPWFVEGQVAGYTLRYENYGFRMTFATLKGSGHSPTQYKPLQCYNMFERWIHYYPL